MNFKECLIAGLRQCEKQLLLCAFLKNPAVQWGYNKTLIDYAVVLGLKGRLRCTNIGCVWFGSKSVAMIVCHAVTFLEQHIIAAHTLYMKTTFTAIITET